MSAKKGDLTALQLRKKAARESVHVARALVAFAEVLEGWDIGPGKFEGREHDLVETFGEPADKKEVEHAR